VTTQRSETPYTLTSSKEPDATEDEDEQDVVWTFPGLRKREVREANDVIRLINDFIVTFIIDRDEWRTAIRSDEDREAVAHAIHRGARTSCRFLRRKSQG
jgi:hypothetical protein